MKKHYLLILVSFCISFVRAQDLTSTTNENRFFFSQFPLYYHFYPSGGNIIPDQSLYSIAYAKSLGFNVIEANVHKCADGVYVTRHGSSGKLGAGLSFVEGCGIDANTAFKDITSTQLRKNVTYNTSIEKYKSYIPTLEEFCAECKRLDMILFLQTINNEVLEIARQYLPDERIIAYGLKARGDFKGMITTWQTITEKTDVLGICNKYGAPYLLGCFISNELSDEKYKEICNMIHENGYYIATAYISGENIRRFKKIGFDAFASTYGDVNIFYEGNKHNISTLDAFSSTTTLNRNDDGSYVLPKRTVLTLDDKDFSDKFGKCCLKIKYKGSLNIGVGAHTNSNVESDGNEFVEIAYEVAHRSNILKLTAVNDVTIYSINVASSIIPDPEIPQTYHLNVGECGYATMFLDNAAYIPSGVNVYIAKEVYGGVLKMTEITDAIPANTGVVVKASEGVYSFTPCEQPVAEIVLNLFNGTIVDTYIQPLQDEICYVLSMLDGTVGFYGVLLDAEGCFKNNAHRAYLNLSKSHFQAESADYYRLEFGEVTDVENIATDSLDNVYYDVYGRRVEKPSNGIYILNGRLRLIK